MHCLLRIDGSILPGVFLTSSFCNRVHPVSHLVAFIEANQFTVAEEGPRTKKLYAVVRSA